MASPISFPTLTQKITNVELGRSYAFSELFTYTPGNSGGLNTSVSILFDTPANATFGGATRTINGPYDYYPYYIEKNDFEGSIIYGSEWGAYSGGTLTFYEGFGGTISGQFNTTWAEPGKYATTVDGQTYPVEYTFTTTSDLPTISIEPISGSNITLVEGGPLGGIRAKLSSAAAVPIILHASLSPSGWGGDLTFSAGLTIPAGTTSIDFPLANARKDNILEPIESGAFSFSASSGQSNVTIAGSSQIPVNVKDAVLSEPPPPEMAQGIDRAKTFMKVWLDTVKVLSAILDGELGPKSAAGSYFSYLKNLDKIAKPTLDGLKAQTILQAKLEQAEKISITDPVAGANAAYAAYETANVTYAGSLYKAAIVGSTAAFAGGLVAGLASLSLAAALPVIATVAVGWAATIPYDKYIAPLIEKKLIEYFREAHPKPQFILDYLSKDEVTLGTSSTDKIFGTGDMDAISGRGGNDLLHGKASADYIWGDTGQDQLFGGSGNDWLIGGKGNDRLLGEIGADRLQGGHNKDLLIGGAGQDIFIFDDKETGASKKAADYILDFKGKLGDKIDFSLVDANVKAGGDQDFTFIGKASVFTGVGQVRYERTKTDTWVYLNTDADVAAEAVIRLKGGFDLSKGWLLL